MKNKLLIAAILIFIIGFYLGSKFSMSTKTEKTVLKVSAKDIYPQCIANICPRFNQIDAVPTNRSPETSIIIPLAMTQGFGKLVIVEEGGKKLFDSGGLPEVGVQPVKDGDGFILDYSSARDENLNASHYAVRYIWDKGKFIKK